MSLPRDFHHQNEHMLNYLFGGHAYSPDHPQWQRVLQKAYASKLRPLCLCHASSTQIPLYIALSRGQYQLKRMPYSGSTHAPHCDHYEPPPELSGLGQVSGSAIREELESETTLLSLDFALTKGRSRQPSASSEVEHESVRSDGTKLTMRGLLHFLWDDAALTRWSPAMEGRRSWFVVRRELLKAASSKVAKGQSLAELLYIPETYNTDRAGEIRQRQREALARLADSSSARMVLIGELKAIEEARFGKCLVIKHMPETRLMINDDLHKRLTTRFAHQLQLVTQLEYSKLVMLATISQSSQGVYFVESACLMNVNEHWIPFETSFDYELLDVLHREKRRFTKGLRYNLPSSKPLACAVLQDTGDTTAALFVVSEKDAGAYDAVLDDMAEHSGMLVWQWRVGAEPLPALPLDAASKRAFEATGVENVAEPLASVPEKTFDDGDETA